jgi:hypothetical protein
MPRSLKALDTRFLQINRDGTNTNKTPKCTVLLATVHVMKLLHTQTEDQFAVAFGQHAQDES